MMIQLLLTLKRIPQGLEAPEEFKKGAPALRLLKGLYGLKQAPRIWNDLVNCNAASSQLTLVYTLGKKNVSLLSSLFMLMITSY